MQQFLKIIECLKKDRFYAIMVEDADTNYQFKETFNNKPTINLTGEVLIANYGSIEAFFNKLFEENYDRIRINFRRSNGNVYKTVGDPVVFALNEQNKQHEPRAAKKAKEYEDSIQGLGKVQTQFNALRYPEVVKERDEYKEKYSKAKKKLRKMEIAAIEQKHSAASSSETKKMLLGYAPVIKALLTKGGNAGALLEMGEDAVEGMAMPEISENKIGIMQRINNLDDDSAYFIGLIAEGMANPEVQASVLEIVKKHNLDTEG